MTPGPTEPPALVAAGPSVAHRYAAVDVHYPASGGAHAAVVVAALVAGMAGPHRLPDALRRVDSLARGHALPRATA
ncbi:hypothetical protein [Phytohabitans kaempferiae]|uniref:Uncharacterized protein n=1 Tax=Phytohabitans kaempferiae TaxID=1620943 RepID=A0ABV6MH57_9ACTN